MYRYVYTQVDMYSTCVCIYISALLLITILTMCTRPTGRSNHLSIPPGPVGKRLGQCLNRGSTSIILIHGASTDSKQESLTRQQKEEPRSFKNCCSTVRGPCSNDWNPIVFYHDRDNQRPAIQRSSIEFTILVLIRVPIV